MKKNNKNADEAAERDHLISQDRYVLEAMGEKSYDKFINAIERKRVLLKGQFSNEALDEMENEAIEKWDESRMD